MTKRNHFKSSKDEEVKTSLFFTCCSCIFIIGLVLIMVYVAVPYQMKEYYKLKDKYSNENGSCLIFPDDNEVYSCDKIKCHIYVGKKCNNCCTKEKCHELKSECSDNDVIAIISWAIIICFGIFCVSLCILTSSTYTSCIEYTKYMKNIIRVNNTEKKEKKNFSVKLVSSNKNYQQIV